MSRQPRVVIVDVAHHVTQRGHGGRPRKPAGLENQKVLSLQR